ncbi:non-ribosomal peptide synthetase [Pseudomonas sp. zfem002]|uniref:non-ribosomal peptide synthetase n=1 Tax=Pseudomonas sp. zfem002 TaxID=3078197 RepID=UPI0029287C28|nr:non-ribosomal peptide synthetase [Pseudomonas sp. zfem002]MDU9390191.1 amino acid adenylation domain-containing protein [Pseudomonas sp. zfem002]
MQALLDSVKSLSARERKALAALLKRQGVNLYGVTPIFRREAEDSAALSYAQRRQWFLWQLEPHSAAYNMPVALRLNGALDIDALRRSFSALVARHETLRTTFREDGDEALQVIHAAQPFVLEAEPLAADLLHATVEEEIQRPFDLRHGPLLRVRLFALGEDRHVLVLTQHHIVSDGWSMPIMIDELVRCYEGYSQGREVHLPGLPIQYADYAIWQRNWMEAGEQERQLAYWKEQLGGEQPVLELPTDRPRPSQPSWRGGRVQIELGQSLGQDLKHLARQQGVTLFMLLLASLQTLLHRYSGQADIRIGVPVANRNRAETEGLIGFFVNTQVLKAEFDGRSTVASLLQQVKQTVVGAQAHQDLPFEQLVEALQPERSMSRSPLFQVIFNHQTEVRGEARQLAGLQVEGLESDKHTAQFDLALNTFESEAGVGASLVFASDLFDAGTVERMAGHWRNLLRGMCANSAERIAELPLHSGAERERTLRDWNRQLTVFPSELCTHQLIEAQAARVPHAVALSFGAEQLTYAQLNARANQLAHKLREQGVGPDVLVGLSTERSLEMLVGVLGILKAGGAYVPLDPDYPQDRLDYMQADSGIKLLLTRADLLDSSLGGYSRENPVNLTSPDNLAYVIYTSGSTGKPKGALLPHHNLLRLFTATDKWFGFDDKDVWTLFHSYAFDFSVWEIFGALLYGGRLVIVPRETTRSPEDFHQLLVDENVTVLNQTPSAFKQLARVACESSADLALRYVVFGGEALDVGSLKPWFERFGDAQPQLINMYGITETTVHVTYRPISKLDLAQSEVSPIGEAIPDLSWYVLDADFNPVALGCNGELHVGHAGLARGYHNRAALTAERFVPDPFSTDGGRLYRTGDLARYRAEGVIEYAGRIDHQVKIRGFRIELGEIEARLQEHPAVREAIVLAVDGAAGQQLAGWFVPRDPAQTDLRDSLKAHLKANLPDYMVPTHLIALEAMPLTANGKLDRKALPKPDASQLQNAYVAPVSELEQQLAAIWAEILKVEQVGLTDNFFELGGHSLLATQVISRVRKQLDLELSLRNLFEAQDLAAFARAAAQGQAGQAPAFARVDRAQPLALSYAQQRQWFLWQLEPHSAAYNIPVALRLRGDLDIEALRRSFEALVARHETLRTTFRQDGEQAVQIIHAAAPFTVQVETLAAGETLENFVQHEVQRPFDLEHGPLLRIRLLRLAADEHVLVLTQHHIVSDGWSMPIMVDELVRHYAAFRQGQALELPALAFQYADYAQWQRNWMDAGEQARQLAYWTAQLGGEQPVLELPSDRPRPAIQSRAGGWLAIPLEPVLVERLKDVAREQGVTLFMLLLASFQTLLHRYSGQSDIRVGVPIANRNRAETEGLIGFFVNTQVLKAGFDTHTTVAELLQQVRQHALQAQAHQDLPFEQLVEALQPGRDLSRTPLFQVMYNHQVEAGHAGQKLPGLSVEGLESDSQASQFDLSLNTVEHAHGVGASFTFASALFDLATIQRMAAHWRNLLRALGGDPRQRISELPLLDAAEQQRIAGEWNATAVAFSDRPVHELIAAQAQRTPDATALILGQRQLGYAELERQANRLAGRLREQGVGPDVLVGIALERSLEMVVGLLAILKAGGAYVPLDPAYPRERLDFMLRDSGVRLLLTHSTLLEQLPIHPGLETLSLDAAIDWDDTREAVAPTLDLSPEHLAYVIYTSGSTGRPKGVEIRHGALTNHMLWMQGELKLASHDRVLQKTAFSFDASVWEFWLPLLNGAQLVLASPALSDDLSLLWDEVAAQRISILQLAPSVLQALLPEARAGQLDSLRLLAFGGEALSSALVEQLGRQWGGQVCNLYGPTEATIDTSSLLLEGAQPGAIAAIGRPISNVRTYVLDANLQLCAPGSAGELYIGGVSLARGYHRRPDLSAERFVPDPFTPGARLYRSGDLVRQRADGVIDYLGRIDHQVKIHGLRIELGEIEARIVADDAVREAVVLPWQSGNATQLVAYVVAAQEADLAARLKAALARELPAHMLPGHWLFLERLPLTANGKLDRKALPTPDAGQARGEHVAPQGELEQRIAAIWQDVLKLPRVGATDNFFELGGDSIISIQVVSRARQAGILFTPKDLFQRQTVQGIAQVARRAGALSIDQGPVTGEAPLTPIQQWFFDSPIPARDHWNQSVLLRPARPLDPEHLRQALDLLAAHHDALRARFAGSHQEFLDSEPRQRLWVRQLGQLDDLEALANEAQRSLSLEQGDLLRALLVELPGGEQRLLLAIHHLVVDGVSWRILLEDLQSACNALAAGKAPLLPGKTSAFKDWAEHLQRYAGSAEREAELAWWQAQLHGVSDELPRDRADGSLAQRHALTVHSRLDRELTRQLLQDAPAAYRTQINDLLLSALARTISRWTGRADTLVRLEGHGREDLFEGLDITRTVGWFTSMYPVKLSARSDAGDAIKTVKEQLRAVPDKGIGYGLLRHLGSEAARRSLAGLAEGAIVFNYLGQFDASFADDDALFVPAAESAGDGQSLDAPLGSLLSINGQVYGGELALGWTFSAEVFDKATVQRLADDYARELTQLIGHCLEAGVGGMTPSDFPLAGLSQAQLDRFPVAAADIADVYPLSPMQQGMLFHSLSAREAGNYINQMRIDVQGLDVARFQAAWQAASDRHDMLRASFHSDFEQPLQVIHKQLDAHCIELDARGQRDLPAFLDEWAQADRQRGFDLERAPLLRIALLRVADDRHHLVYTSHHILMDGWSNSQLLGEVLQRYRGQAVSGSGGRYRDYIEWLQRQDRGVSERFWREQLSALDEPTRLLQTFDAPREGAGQGEHVHVFDREQTRRLNDFAREQRVTVNTLVQAAWLLVLQRHSGQACVTFGATVAGRPAQLPGAEEQLGLFINTLPVVASPRGEQRVAEWVQQVQAHNLALREHEHTPLYEIQRWAGWSGEALFDNILVFENYPVAEALQQAAPDDLVFSASQTQEQTHYALTLLVGVGQTLLMQYAYDRQRVAADTVTQLAAQFATLLLALIEDPAACLGQLPLVADAERERMLVDWNRSQLDYPREQCLPALFEAQVRATPQAVALLDGETSLSYAQLNAQANALAHKLRELGVGADALVGVALERGPQMVVGLLAILKAGGAYVPLDPDFPADRLSYMMQDSGLKLLLTQSSLLGQLSIPAGVQNLCLDQDSDWLDGYSQDNLPALAAPQNLAYAIYTSGSTGLPKGVTIAHQALVNFLVSMGEQPGMAAGDRVLSLTSLSFDIAGLELYLPLIRGAAVVVLRSGQNKDPQALLEVIERQRVSLIQATPSSWRMLLDAAPAGALAGKTVLCGGEALSAELAQRLIDQAGHVWNVYGPTETTIWSARHYLTRSDDVWLGKPLGNTNLHVLSDDFAVLPVGARGELLIGGDGLARGYHQRPSLTAQRFVPDPFGGQGGRLYRTGDLARYHADGVLEYVGRLDHQVKIRGFRIELGEIEARLLEHGAVHQAVVIDIEVAGNKQLAAYLVAGEGVADPEALRDELRAHLKVGLPDYMVPGHLQWLPRMPLTPNGKLDRKALPKPDASLAQGDYQAPRTEQERRLAAIWSEVLGVERVGLRDNFFALGGHSLLVIAAVGKIREAFEISLSLNDFLLLETFEDLAELLRADERRVKRPVVTMNAHDGAEPPLFCLPPGGGAVYSYYPLAGYLGAARRVVGVVNRNYVVPGWFDESWEGMIGYYVEQIRATQAQGPYHLLGWSLGGALAMDVAHALEQAGQEVAFLGLVDTSLPVEDNVFAPDAPPAEGEAPLGLMEDLVRSLLAFVPGIGERVVLDLVAEGRERFVEQDQIADWVIVEVAQRSGVAVEGLRAVYRDIAVQDEIESGYKLLSANIRLSQAFTLKPLRVAPHCWWAGASKTLEEIAAADAVLKAKSAVNGLVSSTLEGENHDGIILGDALLGQVLGRLKAL